MRSALAVVVMALLAATAFAAEATKDVLASTGLGISIEVPYVGDTTTPTQQLATLWLAPADKFAANVNMQKQKFDGAMAEYDAISTKQIEQAKLTMIKHVVKGDELVCEYQGQLHGHIFHWYTRALRRSGWIYIATATGLDRHWEREGAALVKSVDSFTVTK